MDERNFRDANISDADRCFAIETSAYEGDEAATHSKISKRIATYPEGFLILEVDGEVVGFINSGCAYEVEMSDEGFKELIGHDPDAPNVVIMSVVVDPAQQGLVGVTRADDVGFAAADRVAQGRVAVGDVQSGAVVASRRRVDAQ